MLAGTFAACESELEHYTVSAPTATTVTSDNSSVDVTEENTGDVLLTFSYESLGSMSDGDVSTNQGAYVLQASSSSSFENFVTKVGSNATGKQSIKLTGEELNVMASKLGIAGGEYSDIYFRIATLYNENNYQDAKYSDPITVSVKPLKIFMHYLMLSFKSDAKEDAVDSLYSPKEDGIYKGFVKVASWWNWCAYDALGTRYATDEKDGWKFAHMYNTEVDGSNLWFPGIGGCYYVTANTNDGAIEYTYIPSLTVSGGAEGSLSLAQEVCHWTGVITTTADNQNITISGKTYTFNQATGQGEAIDDGIPTEGNISFAGADGVLTVGDGSISVPKAGQYLLILDLDNSAKFTYTLKDMSSVVTYPDKVIAVVGETETELQTEISGGLASGIYTGSIVAGAKTVSFKDGDGKILEVALVDASDNALSELNVDGKYTVTLDLVNKIAKLSEILYEKPNIVYTYGDPELTKPLATYHTVGDGVFKGLYWQEPDSWNFYAKDNNDVVYGVQKWEDNNNNQFTFFAGSTANFWLDPNKSFFLTINADMEGTWSAMEVTSVHIVGNTIGWNFEDSNKFTDNGDGTWSFTTNGLNADYNQIIINASWDYKLGAGSDNVLRFYSDDYQIKADTDDTYKVVINFKTNTISIEQAK
jgi:hypothetical protein